MRASDRRRTWEEFAEGQELPSLAFPLSIHRLVVTAGANRDFNAIHHNRCAAQDSGAADIYANNIFLLGMWERTVREFVGCLARIQNVRGFRMKSFNCAGDTVRTFGRVEACWRLGAVGWLTIGLWSDNDRGRSVGPGTMLVELPTRDATGLSARRAA